MSTGWNITILSIAIIIIIGLSLWASSYSHSEVFNNISEYSGGDEEDMLSDEEDVLEKDKFTPLRIEIPDSVKAVYMTSCIAGTPSLREKMVQLIEETELNSIVIDIKDFTGMISFLSEDSELSDAYATHCPVKDMKEFVHSLNKKDIFVIGRVTVFQDSFLAKKKPEFAVKRESDDAIWKDNKGIHFTDPGAKEVWDYHIRLAKESYNIGFDEINFDYIRFPSDGPMSDIYFPVSEEREKSEVLEEFFSYLYEELKDVGVITSADLFGMTTSSINDLGIGQIWEKALPYFDYLSPMVYPSHYPHGFKGLGNPNHYPYEIVKWSLDDAIERTVATSTVIQTMGSEMITNTDPDTTSLYSKKSYDPSVIRPWIQDFRYGGTYGPDEVRTQIQAVYDSGLDSWMLWDPANRYTPAALEPAP